MTGEQQPDTVAGQGLIQRHVLRSDRPGLGGHRLRGAGPNDPVGHRQRPDPARTEDQAHRSSSAFAAAFLTASGVSGSRLHSTPRALATALATAPGGASVPPSPTPLAPLADGAGIAI